MSVKDAGRIQLRAMVSRENRTEDKDAAAWYILREVVWADRWPVTMTEIADETQWSRQHITNTLESYFEEAETEWTREDVFDAYRRGYRDRERDMRKE